MEDRSNMVRMVDTRRIPGHVHQYDNTVRVFRNMRDRVQLQLRSPKWYSTASLTADETRAVIAALQEGLD